MARRAVKIAAGLVASVGCGTVVAVVALGVVALVLLSAFSLSFEGCEADLGGFFDDQPLALTRNLDGTIQARTACGATVDVQSIELRGPDGAVLWSVLAPSNRAVSSVTIGRVPEGFEEQTPLTEVLRDGVDYLVVWVSSVARALTTSTTTEPAGAGTSGATQVFANIGAFRPEQVQVGRVLFQGADLTPAELAQRTCR